MLPRSKKSKGGSAGPAVADPNPPTLENEDLQHEEPGDVPAGGDDYELLALDPEIEFFDLMQMLPEGAWDECSIYLYRLDPPVSNKASEKKYIALYGAPLTQEGVKKDHGGGKYEAYLKQGTRTLRRHKFSIEGAPIFQEGQTVRGGAGSGSPIAGNSGTSDAGMADIVRQVIAATKGDTKAVDAGIEVMKTAMLNGQELLKNSVAASLNSDTGSKLGDKLLEALLPRLTAPPAPPTPQTLPPIVEKFLETALTVFKSDRKENPVSTPPQDPMQQLTFVKDLLGVESLREFFTPANRAAEAPWWIGPIGQLIERLPTVLAQVSEMQQQAFQRAIVAHQLALSGRVLPPGAPAPALAPFTPAAFTPPARAAAPAAAPPIPGATPAAVPPGADAVAQIVEAICRAYDEGYPGDVAGAHLRLLNPALTDQLKPLLTDRAQLRTFVQQIPPLAERAAEPDWPEFEGELIEELSQNPEAAAAESVAAAMGAIPPSEIIAPGAAVAAPAAVPARPHRSAPVQKKKANGAVA